MDVVRVTNQEIKVNNAQEDENVMSLPLITHSHPISVLSMEIYSQCVKDLSPDKDREPSDRLKTGKTPVQLSRGGCGSC